MERETFAISVTTWDTSRRIADITNALTVLFTNPTMMKTNAQKILDSSKRKTSLSNKNHHLLLPSKSHLHKSFTILNFHPNYPVTKTANHLLHPNLHLAESSKGDEKERNQSGGKYKRVSTEVQFENWMRWTKNITKISTISLQTSSTTMIMLTMKWLPTSSKNHMYFDSHRHFEYNRGVLL